MIRRLAAVLAVVTVALAAIFAVSRADRAAAQDFDAPTRIAGAKFDPAEASPGESARLLIEIEIGEGWHLYSQQGAEGQKPAFRWTLPDGWTAGDLDDESETHEFDDAGVKVQVHEGRAVLAQTFDLSDAAKPGEYQIRGVGDWQVCNANECRFAKGMNVVAKVVVTPPAPKPAAPAPAADVPPSKLGAVRFEPPAFAPGATVRALVEIDLAEGWHVYAQDASPEQRPEITWTLPAGWTAVGPLADLSEAHAIDDFGVPARVIEKRAVLAQTFTVAADAAPGPVEIRGTAQWQVCRESCEFVKGIAVSVKGDVRADAAPTPAPTDDAPKGDAPKGDAPPAAQSWADLLGSAVFWGFLTVLTPCVFPLLPVTVSFFSKQQGPALPRSIVYGFGIVFTITVIGLVFKSSLDVMARGWVFNLAVGVLFLALSLSLFGLFDLKLPGFLTDWSQSKAGGGGLAGPFFMAVTLALTSFSCSMPFLATMFTQFDQGDHVRSVVGLAVYGSTMATPFVLCSLFPASVRSLPRAGAWMNAVKVTMGFVEFALAFKFLRTVCINFGWDYLPRGFVLAIWAACALGAALYLLGYVVLPHDTKVESIGVVRLLFAITFLSSAIYLFPGVAGSERAAWIESFLQTDAATELAAAPGERGGGDTAVATDPLPRTTSGDGTATAGGGTATAGGAVLLGSGNGGVAAPAGGGAARRPPVASHVEWPRNDWDGALERAVRSKRPLLFDFTGVG